jgi:methionine sulfoxide reductase catalytic subunit
MMQ